MNDILTIIIFASSIVIAFALYLVSFLRFRSSRLTKDNSISTTGILVGFRKYYVTDQWGENTEDYPDNKKGRLPIINFNLDGESLDIAAIFPNKKLTQEDIGKQVKIRYRKFIGITLVIDDEDDIIKHNKRQNLFFWTLSLLATIILTFGIYLFFK